MAARVVDEPGRLQLQCGLGDRLPAHAQQLGDQLLRSHQIIALQPIKAWQEPATELLVQAEVAQATLQCLRRVVPAAVPGVMFLSGGQSGELASSSLNAMHVAGGATSDGRPLPWSLSFSFARAIQHPALDIWAGKPANRVAAQRALLHRARCNAAALKGEYSAAMEGVVQ